MRIAVFASYDKKGKVHAYVLSYLRYLREVTDKIVFIADNEAPQSEQKKLAKIVDYAQFKRHGEYDFGSYKRGIEYAEQKGWLAKADELILCNDSCFCVRPLKDIFEEMEDKKCDFWGMSASKEFQPHLQSFFLVFKKKAFTSEAFRSFIQAIQKQPDVKQVILKYEIPLKAILNKSGLQDEIYLAPQNGNNPMMYSIDCLEQGFPFVKKKAFLGRGNSFNSATQILKTVKKISPTTARNVIRYFKRNFCLLFPLITRERLDATHTYLHKFFWQKKRTKSGKLTIKIFRIPVYRRKK